MARFFKPTYKNQLSIREKFIKEMHSKLGIFIETPSRWGEAVLKRPPSIPNSEKSYQDWLRKQEQLSRIENENEKQFFLRNEELNKEIDRKIEWINKRRDARKEEI